MKKRFIEEQIVKMIQEHKQGKVFVKSVRNKAFAQQTFTSGRKSMEVWVQPPPDCPSK